MTLIMAFWILRDNAPPNESWQYIRSEISSQPCVGQTFQKWRKGAMMMMMTMTPTFFMKQLKPQLKVTTMNLDPNIQLFPLIILLGHKS